VASSEMCVKSRNIPTGRDLNSDMAIAIPLPLKNSE
jgi:hypothetical protein